MIEPTPVEHARYGDQHASLAVSEYRTLEFARQDVRWYVLDPD